MRNRARRPACLVVVLVAAVACTQPAPEPVPQAAPDSTAAVAPVKPETVVVRDPQLQQRVAQLELRLMEKDAQIEDMQKRLDDANREVVRSMAKLQSTATRAEAASAMAEADIAVEALRVAAGGRVPNELTVARRWEQQATDEFNRQNYGGALYMANQAKVEAGKGRGRLVGGDLGTPRTGETSFAVPVRLVTTQRANLREGPGQGFKLVVALPVGAAVIGYSYLDQWVRVADDSGRTGWLLYRLVKRP